MDILITPGNTNMTTFEVVCRAVREIWPDTIGYVYVLDSQQSAAQAVEEKRDVLLRSIFGADLEISTAPVNESNLQSQIPNKLSRILRDFSSQQIVVDLTNGQKFTASVLYATASISQIKRIYSLLPKIDFRSVGRSQLASLQLGVDYEYIHLEPLLDIQNVARSSFLELIYYRDEIESVTEALQRQDESFANDTRRALLHSLSNYFVDTERERADVVAEKYNACVGSLGRLCEGTAERIYTYLVHVRAVSELQHLDFNAYVEKISAVLNAVRKIRPPQSFNPIQEGLKPLASADGLLKMAHIYRNIADHPKAYLYAPDRDDVKLNLDATLLLLLRLSQTNVLTETIRRP
jgi:hypothetical protein